MNKKGFTLVEILSVLVLISLLLGLAIPGINKIRSNMKKKSYSKKVSLVLSAAELWGSDNKTLLQSSSDCEIKDGEKVSCYKITVGSLIENNYLDSDKNSGEYISPLDNSDMRNHCVYVYKKNNRVYSEYVSDSDCENKSTSKPSSSDDNITITKTILKDNVFVDSKSKERKAPAIKIDIESSRTNLKNVKLKYTIGGLVVEESKFESNQRISVTKNILEFLEKCNENLDCQKTYIRDEKDKPKLDDSIISNFKITINIIAQNENEILNKKFDLSLDVEQIDASFINSKPELNGINDAGDMVFTVYGSNVDKNTTGSTSSISYYRGINYFSIKNKINSSFSGISKDEQFSVDLYDWNDDSISYLYKVESCKNGICSCSVESSTYNYKNYQEKNNINYVKQTSCRNIIVNNPIAISNKFKKFSDTEYKDYFDNIFYYFTEMYESNNEDFRYNITTNTDFLNRLIEYEDNDGNKRFYCIITFHNRRQVNLLYQILTFGENLLKISDS